MRKRRATLRMVYLSESIKGKRITFMRDNFDWIDFLPFWKGVYSKRKEFAPRGSKFFPIRVDLLSKED